MADSQGLLRYLSTAAARLGTGVARPTKSPFGSNIRRLRLALGPIHYEIRQEGSACVVERQAIVAGMSVGMKDTVPASTWPQLLVLDVARTADEKGLGWQAVAHIFS
ncbi:MAG: hypothetical protein J2P57_14780 [Acidimicrobiaceae bacterium]|nr:hypothetical protein [Acidimicrobiaceae bacterium]